MSDRAARGPLGGRRIALLESREAARLAHLLAEQGAEVVSCPAVAIVDPPDPGPVLAWLHRFIADPPDLLVLMTGEGLCRLHAAARRSCVAAEFVAAIACATTVTRGPKPTRALRALGLGPGLRATPPTSDGIVSVLSGIKLDGRRVGVQLYPGAVDGTLLGFLRAANANIDAVTPYDYAAAAADAAVIALIDRLASGDLAAIAFTSASQVGRLFEVARASGVAERLHDGLERTAVAAVGPLAAAALGKFGVAAHIVPADAYFMKPLVSAIVAALTKLQGAGA